MFRRTQPDRAARELRDELQSLCRSMQISTLTLSPHLRRDIGLDCGCHDTLVRK